ncbi:hypothetical protein [Streptomyces sp. NBC_00996]|uniref:hypothetical protein n=1 Tax=Streptomyces sp. NBC_00996 TaxID=2903710 RepID=UPI00386862B8|nr:hypothetical protein OG390_27045 [Streptomyces sp. NBC_00996]
MHRNPVMRTLAAALLAGGVIVGAVASPASAAATTHGAASLSPNSQANGGCRFGVGFNRGFNPYCGFGYGYPFGTAGFFGGYPYSNTPVVVIVR